MGVIHLTIAQAILITSAGFALNDGFLVELGTAVLLTLASFLTK